METSQEQSEQSPHPSRPPPRDRSQDVSTTSAGSDSVDSQATPTPTQSHPTRLPDFDGPPPTSTIPPSIPSSWSASSDRQLGHGQGTSSSQQDYSDRVFPIRSAISVDSTSGRQSIELDYFRQTSDSSRTPMGTATRIDTELAATRASSISVNTEPAHQTSITSPITSPVGPSAQSRRRRGHTMGGAMSSVQADAERHGTVPPISIEPEPASDDERSQATGESYEERSIGSLGGASAESIPDALMAARFQHVVTDEGHAVITGREGTLQRCEDEPIHTPGAVQGFGLLLAIREEQDGRFAVRYTSENSRRIIGYTPQQLFKLDNFLDIFSDEQADNLLDHIDFIRDEDADPAVNGPEVFSVTVRPPKSRSNKLWCAMHINAAHPDLVICEFELDDDLDFPLRPSDELTPDIPEDTLQSNPTLEELTESTEILSKPLRVLRSARKRRGEAGAMQVFDIMSQVQEQLASASNLESFLKILVGIVKELTGFHRVMIYQFDSSFNGKVVTELVDPVQTRDLYKGLHFPASDIPRQARELYKINRVRLLYDRDHETARMVCRSTEDLEVPLDMTHSYLRAMSPIHLKYLANMAVRSSMSISINAFGELWGLIACHSYGHKGMRVSFPIRKMCRLVGDTVSRNIERLSYASRLQARKLINTAPTDKNPSGYIIASSDDLLKLFDADFGMLSIRGETKIMGKIEQSQEALAMLEYLRLRKFTSVVTSQDVKQDFPDLRYPPGFSVIAGLLYVPLSVGGHDFIVFFRKGQIREVKWAGNPYEKFIKEGTAAYLEPRKSFRTWHETVLGKCREWSEEQVETAAVLCLVYGKFIEVWRQKEAALQNSRFTRLLLANSAHEVRTPLNAIINYLEIALEGTLDQEIRDNLARSHSASKSLIYVINDLLDLTKAEEGQELVKDEIFDFPACIREATEPFQNDARRKNINYEVVEHPGLPRHVIGDQRRVRQAVANVTANAVQSTSKGMVKIELYAAEVQDCHARIEIVVQDTGAGMSSSHLDNLFQDLEQVTTDFDESRNLDETEGKPQNTRTLGLGLAVVARIVRNMDGQLRLKSEEGVGSRFVIQLPFDLPPNNSPEAVEGSSSVPAAPASVSNFSVPSDVSRRHEGEVLLVDRGSTSNPNLASISQKKSMEDIKSLSSQRTGTSKSSVTSNKSDAERLIDAIQTPLFGGQEGQSPPLHRKTSSGPFFTTPSWETDDGGSVNNQQSRTARPSGPSRSVSMAGKEVQISGEAPPGEVHIKDTKTPIKPVRIPDNYKDLPERPQPNPSSGVLFEISDVTDHAAAKEQKQPEVATGPLRLRVLVAEDDPINFKILSKRLQKAGHEVIHAVNGEDCAQLYKEKPSTFDVVLMDMQMPIVDGLTSTKMIREIERRSSEEEGCGGGQLSALARPHGHVPIFAVSASLVEREKDTYVGAGFDGWILKPIDFKRLEVLLSGIRDGGVRDGCAYRAGQWEQGGWFSKAGEGEGEGGGAKG
ncbi:uncharacterized protein E0L32_010964 [Thyridium curvatum]|uniref:Phytochrome n=1 Tax=Thyridium curvatum TaxID=1093900 RepID=A0A507AQC3_9PEZI|nr:uncharacterized protein E0L32_010964 [Thyridium curvatum]TPX07069.1 hypothetical protein E0L32_010964 [Thyridium curvatum]